MNSLTELSEKRAVSDPEKKAEKQRRMKIRITLTRARLSKVYRTAVNGLSTYFVGDGSITKQNRPSVVYS